MALEFNFSPIFDKNASYFDPWSFDYTILNCKIFTTDLGIIGCDLSHWGQDSLQQGLERNISEFVKKVQHNRVATS